MHNQNQKNGLLQKFQKLQKRLERALSKGTFLHLAKNKQNQLARRLQRYAWQLKRAVKPTIATAFLTLGLSGAAFGQVVINNVTGANNALNGVSGHAPTFVDIDNDGDMDCFIGLGDGSVVYYENSGNNAVAVFSLQSGANNPLDGEDVGQFAIPTFVDIDGDGDMDCFIGEASPVVNYYENTGSNASPIFMERTGALNPLNAVYLFSSGPAFVDIDGDGDMDCFSSEKDGTIKYFKNNGNATTSNFVEQTGANNPFNNESWGANSYGHISFADLDKDGDKDAFLTDVDGANGIIVHYYENTGSSTVPAFTHITGGGNPFNSLSPFQRTIAFVDIDGDGDMDCFGGNGSSAIKFYHNDTPTSLVQVENQVRVSNVFPNPSNGHIHFEKGVSGALKVYNLIGQQVFSNFGENIQSINLESLEVGIYFLSVENEKILTKIEIK